MQRLYLLQQLFVLAPLVALASPAEADSPQPNFLLVFIDDMGWGDLSCFGGSVQTQHLDQLAAEGMRFEQFYVNSPICSPSRVAISTGQYPQRWRITSFLSNRRSNRARGMAQWLDPEAPMLARSLQQAGYVTGHFGKWHMGGQRDVGEAPLISRYGFDESLTNFEGLGPRVLPLKDAYDGQPPARHGLGSDHLGRGPVLWQDRSRITQTFATAALEFIEWAEDRGRPFYVNLWPDDVHAPFFPPRERRTSGNRRDLYQAVLDTMDEQLGPVLDYIRSSEQLRENTLILVCSDNGPDVNAGSAGPFRGVKATLYEGGIRSPLIIWGPGRMNRDQVGSVNRDSVFAAVDLVPSLLAIAGVSSGTSYDGENLAGVLLGDSTASRRQPIFFRRPPDREQAYGLKSLPDLAVRDGPWKFLCEFDGARPQLYDLTTDRSESKNLAGDHPEIVRRLSQALLAWHKAMPPDTGATFQPGR